MEKEQDRALVKASVPERELDPAKAMVLVLEKEPERAQAWGQAGEMEWDPVWGLVLVPVLALELVQARETDRVTDQELEWESAEYRCHPLCHHPAFHLHRADCCH